MTWEKFCELGNVPKRYRNAHAETLNIPPDSRGDSYTRKAMKLISKPCSVLLMGKAGRGKTHFMFSIIRGLLEIRKVPLGNLRFYRSIDLDYQLVESFEKYKSVQVLIDRLVEMDYLFIDDFGLERKTEKAERDYYDLIDKRTSEEKITIFSTNLNEEGLKNTFGERIASRLKECAVLEFEGPDLREGEKL